MDAHLLYRRRRNPCTRSLPAWGRRGSASNGQRLCTVLDDLKRHIGAVPADTHGDATQPSTSAASSSGAFHDRVVRFGARDDSEEMGCL